MRKRRREERASEEKMMEKKEERRACAREIKALRRKFGVLRVGHMPFRSPLKNAHLSIRTIRIVAFSARRCLC